VYRTQEVEALANKTSKTLHTKPRFVRALGIDLGRIKIADDFDSPLPAALLRCFTENPDESQKRAAAGRACRKARRRKPRQSR
jgi:hypothetical protein